MTGRMAGPNSQHVISTKLPTRMSPTRMSPTRMSHDQAGDEGRLTQPPQQHAVPIAMGEQAGSSRAKNGMRAIPPASIPGELGLTAGFGAGWVAHIQFFADTGKEKRETRHRRDTGER